MIKISHEVPLELLEESFNFNAYDYLLPHLYLKYPEYKNHFQLSRKKGRFIIMDNGLFENQDHSEEELIQIMEEVDPDVFIPPDNWNDARGTLSNFEDWIKKVKNKDRLMLVIQANTLLEAEMLHTMGVMMGVKYIGFNHSSAFYSEISNHPHLGIRNTIGRINFISFLQGKNALNPEVNYHLLGTNSISELIYYKDYFPEIKTADTSNPITLAYEGKMYEEGLVMDKPKTKIDEIVDIKKNDPKYQMFEFRALKNISYIKKHLL